MKLVNCNVKGMCVVVVKFGKKFFILFGWVREVLD